MQGRKPILGLSYRASTLIVVALLALHLAGCVTNNTNVSPSAQLDVIDQIVEVDLTPPRATLVKTSENTSKAGPVAAAYHGDGSPATAEARRLTTGTRSGETGRTQVAALSDGTQSLPDATPEKSGDKGYEINFENTPVPTVAKAVLGDILGIGYTIDPRVQGTVSLSSGRAVPRKDLLFVLENALRMSGVALVRDGQDYRLIPSTEAVAAGSADWARDPSAGYGISVIPLQFVSAQTLIKLLDNYAAKPGTVRAEPSRNLLIIQGNSADRRTAIQTVLSFDADWMVG